MAKLPKKTQKITSKTAIPSRSDEMLLPYACITNTAHILTMQKNGQLTDVEFAKAKQSLDEIFFLAEHHSFAIHPNHTNIYQEIDHFLSEKLGKLSEKLLLPPHCDQAALNLCLFMRQHLLKTMEALYQLGKSLIVFTERFQTLPLPNFSPKNPTIGLWGSALLETLLDDLELLKSTHSFIHPSSANCASENEGEIFSKFLGFSYIPHSKYYKETSKGKFEAAFLFALGQTLNDLAKLASDLIHLSSHHENNTDLSHENEILEMVSTHANLCKSYLLQTMDISAAKNTSYCSFQHLLLRPVVETSEAILNAINACKSSLSEIKIQEKTTKSKPVKLVLDPILIRFEHMQKWTSEQNALWKTQHSILMGH